MTDIGILSYPGALSDGNDITTLCTSLLDTAWKRNLSASGMYSYGVLGKRGGRLCKSIKDCESSEAFAPAEVKNWLNSLVTSFRSCVHWLGRFSARDAIPDDFPFRAGVAAAF